MGNHCMFQEWLMVGRLLSLLRHQDFEDCSTSSFHLVCQSITEINRSKPSCWSKMQSHKQSNQSQSHLIPQRRRLVHQLWKNRISTEEYHGDQKLLTSCRKNIAIGKISIPICQTTSLGCKSKKHESQCRKNQGERHFHQSSLVVLSRSCWKLVKILLHHFFDELVDLKLSSEKN